MRFLTHFLREKSNRIIKNVTINKKMSDRRALIIFISLKINLKKIKNNRNTKNIKILKLTRNKILKLRKAKSKNKLKIKLKMKLKK
jgi:hypothetical protein